MDKEEREKKRAASATSMTCPECGSRLYRREGKYGEFLGCGNYPNCKYTNFTFKELFCDENEDKIRAFLNISQITPYALIIAHFAKIVKLFY